MSLQKYNENKTNLNFWSYLNNLVRKSLQLFDLVPVKNAYQKILIL